MKRWFSKQLTNLQLASRSVLLRELIQPILVGDLSTQYLEHIHLLVVIQIF